MVAKGCRKYSEAVALRATIQLIPYIGGSLDTLIAGRASLLQTERIEKFIHELKQRLGEIERASANIDDEAFSDLVFATFEKVVRTRSQEKRSRFARIITRQVSQAAQWEEAENAVRLLGELEDIHIEVIRVALAAPRLEKGFEELRVISIASPPLRDADGNGALALAQELPQYGLSALRMACAELVGKGLLHDEGIGRWSLAAMEYFVATDLAEWFSSWISWHP
jgi:hypothetical protein